VVRAAGAAGAKLPVTVDESAQAASPAPEEPKTTRGSEAAQAESSAQSEQADSNGAKAPRSRRSSSSPRSRTRSASSRTSSPRKSSDKQKVEGSENENATRALASEHDPQRQARVGALAAELFSDPGVVSEQSKKVAAQLVSEKNSARPMTSLLFQEPVLPSGAKGATAQAASGDAAFSDSNAATSSRDDKAEDNEGSQPRSRKRRSSKANSTHTRQDQERGNSADDEPRDEESSQESSPRKRSRNRRLNAQERRAAAEVEQIQEDMTHDDVAFSDVDDSSSEDSDTQGRDSKDSRDSSDDSDDRSSRRRRRRRRNGHDGTDERSEQSESTSRSVSRSASHSTAAAEDDEDEAPVTRRRRRRRGSRGEEETTSRSSGRSRKQQYIDEITDIEGSTRLEAKRQRRRDNRRDRSRQTLITEQDFLARRENVDRQMVVREKDRHTQISVIEDDILVEHYVSDIQEVSTVGNIYLGRVQNVLPSMEAAFVDIGKPRNGVLYAGEVNWDSARLEGHPRRIELAYHSGDPVLVQVTKDPIGHKGARLTSQVTLAGRFIVLVPSGAMTGVSRKLPERERARLKKIVQAIAPKDMGVIIRTAAEGASEEAITKDCENLIHQWDSITKKMDQAKNSKKPKLLKGEPDVAIRVVRDIFNDDFRTLAVQGDGVYERISDYLEQMAPDLVSKLTKWDPADHQGKDVFDQWQIDGQLRKGMERQVYLPSGGSLVIDRTEAMTTIDVNTGRFIGKGKSLEETVTRCNLEAAEEIVRQLRLRDIGGMVMIDFVDMVLEANRDLVLRRLVECLARDRTKHQVAEVTSLGLVQMTRKRVGQGLVEAFSEECPTCHGRGFILHDEPTVSAASADPYAVKGGDPFIESNKKRRCSSSSSASSSSSSNSPVAAQKEQEEEKVDNAPKGSTAEVKAKLAAIAAAASRHEDEEGEE
jgi:ribonuclease E